MSQVLSNPHEHQLRVDWNATEMNFSSKACLHKLFEEQVLRVPDSTALICGGQFLSYAELNARSNQLAHHLIRFGVRPDTLVGVCMVRSIEMIVGMLSILKAGGGYVPLDPDYPEDRLDFMLEDTRLPLVLSQQRIMEGTLPDNDARSICLDKDSGEIARESRENPVVNVTEDNLAYVMYTSGSSGQPKGVEVSHRNIVNHMLWMQHNFSLTENDRIIQKTPYSFDASVWEIYAPLIMGGRLIVSNPGCHQDTAYLTDTIIEQHISCLKLVPSLLRLLLDEPRFKDCACLKHVFCGSEVLPVALVERFYQQLPTTSIYNLYGPTEAAVDVTHWPCALLRDNQRSIPIGKPVANTQVYILDEQMQFVPVGEVGELYIGGVQVARGYLNRPELTAETFIKDPFSDKPGARLYRSGDLCRYLNDGTIEFLGRRDHQVKVSGVRIELGEIEAVMEALPQVQQAVVMAREDEPGEKRLVAYVDGVDEESVTDDDLRIHAANKLPDYMVPRAYVILERIPLTASGKVDRSQLPAPCNKRPTLRQDYVPPRSVLEKRLAASWCELIKLDRIGVHDKFFELGGSSLQAAHFIATLRQELGENIYIVSIFESPSIAEYAQFLQREYAEAIAKHFGIAEKPEIKTDIQAIPDNKVNAEMVECMHAFIPKLSIEHSEEQDQERNPQAIFVLAPPRSGTTLLRVMLAGHPQLFAAAELNLLMFNTLEERSAAFSGKFSLWLEGALRTIMEILSCDADEAKSIMTQYQSEHYSTKAFYKVLQEQIGNKILVDKTPAYVLDPGALEKAERDFDNALYIHLVRHPYAMVRSFACRHMNQVLYLKEQSFTPRQLGELVWLISHQNTLGFLKNIPAQRQFHIGFEEMVQQPQKVMEALCAKFDITYHPAMVTPYADIDNKMVDGIYDVSTPMGDTELLKHKRIDPDVAESWRGVLSDNFLCDMTWELAYTFGYDLPQPLAVRNSDDNNRQRQTMKLDRKKMLAHNRRKRLKRR